MEPKQNIQKTTIKFDSISKSPDENLIIGDHPRVIFILAAAKRKITFMAKADFKEEFFGVQKRFLEFAKSKGMIVLGTESTGYLPGMFEFTYPENTKTDSVKIMLKFLHMFIQKEKEIIARIDKNENDFEDRLLQPSDKDSTELGEIPHEERKGGQTNNPYMNYINAWFGWYT